MYILSWYKETNQLFLVTLFPFSYVLISDKSNDIIFYVLLKNDRPRGEKTPIQGLLFYDKHSYGCPYICQK